MLTAASHWTAMYLHDSGLLAPFLATVTLAPPGPASADSGNICVLSGKRHTMA